MGPSVDTRNNGQPEESLRAESESAAYDASCLVLEQQKPDGHRPEFENAVWLYDGLLS